ncbi:MAG TPA: Type 1 glutamine amidotransferase-like domain-containing protein [Dehalococcoidia bacterium]|nr:Type 1 glutamine amidotransferase-like domain-containing protein [Dehalococcoidia bacterium]
MADYVSLGPLVLAGSGEYTPAMDIVDKYVLGLAAGKPVVLIATSCAQEGADVMERWEQMGVAHFARLGVEATPLRIVDNEDADKAEHAGRIAEAGFVWFSGGSPVYLAQAFHETKSWFALEQANRGGTAVAGASGGLGVLNANLDMRMPDAPSGPTALGLGAPIRAMAHFDRMEERRPEFIERILGSIEPGQRAVGVDEDTALVWTENDWRAMGHKRVVVYETEGGRTIYQPGDVVKGLPAPLRARLD